MLPNVYGLSCSYLDFWDIFFLIFMPELWSGGSALPWRAGRVRLRVLPHGAD